MSVNAMTSECTRRITDSCPSGHEMMKCLGAEGYTCRQCSALSFQPNENWLGDKCRLRKVCGKAHMEYSNHGSTTRDADCACAKGYHFQNVDQRACVPNQLCGRGYGQGDYGVCIKCIDQHMYSDTSDRVHKCKPLTNCEKQNRCTVTKSNGLLDNVCGPLVKDVISCDDPQPPPPQDSSDPTFFIIAGGIAAPILLIFVILLIVFFVRRNNLRRRRNAEKPLTTDQFGELKLTVLSEAGRDGDFCKKVLAKSLFEVEKRIERQIWTLAQELYRPHEDSAKYEQIVEKYKDSQHRYAVNGYLQEWRLWRGDNREALGELFRCLAQTKRDDILYEICNAFRMDVGFDAKLEAQLEEEGGYQTKQNCSEDFIQVFFPCCIRSEVKATPTCKVPLPEKKTEKGPEVSEMLLDGSHEPEVEVISLGAQFRARPSPSAPVPEGHDENDDLTMAMHRQCSQPVQCTS